MRLAFWDLGDRFYLSGFIQRPSRLRPLTAN